jgi:hypothetical protein
MNKTEEIKNQCKQLKVSIYRTGNNCPSPKSCQKIKTNQKKIKAIIPF